MISAPAGNDLLFDETSPEQDVFLIIRSECVEAS
jgi:hypothetical protein